MVTAQSQSCGVLSHSQLSQTQEVVPSPVRRRPRAPSMRRVSLASDIDLTQTQPVLAAPAAPPLAVLQGSRRLISLTSLLDHKQRYEFRREQREVRIGRGKNMDLQCVDHRVSKCHLRIYKDEPFGCFIEELSANGCYVNDIRMDQGETRTLRHGDEISLCVLGPHHRADEEPFAAYLFRIDDVVGEVPDLIMDASTTMGSSRQAASSCGTSSSSTSGVQSTDPAVYDPAENLKSEEWVRNTWDLRLQIGSGSFSEVQLGVHVETGKKAAVKVVDKQKFVAFQNKRESHLSLHSEAKVLIGLDHVGIVRCLEWFQTEAYLYLAMEVVEGGDLLQCIIKDGCLAERQAQRIFRDICEAVAYLHSRNVVHRDLKPENILLTCKDRDRMRPKLGDFGLARQNMKSRDCRTFCGTPHYFAPEVINTFRDKDSQVDKAGYGKQADMWSLGVVLYILLSGSPPFEDDGLYEQILQGKYEFDVEEWTSISADAKSMISRLMCVDPQDRQTIEQALEHLWLRQTPAGLPHDILKDSNACEAELVAKRQRCS